MKKLFSILFIFFYSFSSSAQDSIYFLDLDYLLNNSNHGKKIVEKLKIINDQNMSKIKIYENKLKKEDEEINKVKNIISEEELKRKIETLKNNISDYRKKKENIIKDYDNLKKKELENFFKKITPFIEEFMEINSIKIVLDKKNIFIANINYDITNPLIEFLNKKLKND